MWRSATSSELARVALAGVVALVVAAPAAARVFLTTDEALTLAFPECRVERGTVFLTEAQVARATELAGEAPGSKVAHPYRATCDGRFAGTAYFDVHRVRTLPETLMVVVSPEGAVQRVEILSFQEPPEYIPRDAWYEELDGERLDDDLAIKRDVPPVTGATLTARATVAAVRRVLALHRVLAGPSRPAARSGAAGGTRHDDADSGGRGPWNPR